LLGRSLPLQSPFNSGYFGDRVLIYAQVGLDDNPPIYVFRSSWGDKYVSPQKFVRWVLKTFCLGWPGTLILLISVSHVVGMIGTCQHMLNH
jgi:hypothetical protein